MQLYEFLAIAENRDELINYLVSHDLIKKKEICPKCGSAVSLNLNTLTFRCSHSYLESKRKQKKRRVRCIWKKSALSDTCFTQLRGIDIQTVCKIIAYLLYSPPPHREKIIKEFSIGTRTAKHWISFCREICKFWMDNCPQLIGGPNHTVQIGILDLPSGEGACVFGGIDSVTKNCFIEPVPSRSAFFLTEVITRRIAPDTKIICNCSHLPREEWSQIYNLEYPINEAETQTIEELWRDLRDEIPRYGRSRLPYIAEFLFKRHFSSATSADTQIIEEFFNQVKNRHQT